jgi:uncharacterized protein (DUF952 family)
LNELILHLASRAAWLLAKESGEYSPASLSAEGFIHCSKPEQVADVANRFYTGRHDLILLVIDPALLHAELRWEPDTDQPDELFPHLYGPLNLDAIQRAVDFTPGSDGTFDLPADL